MVIEVLLVALMKILLASGVFYGMLILSIRIITVKQYLVGVERVKFCLSLRRRDIW